MAFMFQMKILMREGGLHYHYFLKQNSPLYPPSESSGTTYSAEADPEGALPSLKATPN